MSSVKSASVVALRAECTRMKPNVVESTRPLRSATRAPYTRRLHFMSTATVVQAEAADASRSETRPGPNALKASAMSHTASGGLEL